MSKRVKWSIAGAVGLVIVLVGGLGAAKRGNKSVEVRIEPVEKRDLVASVTASGQVRPQTKVENGLPEHLRTFSFAQLGDELGHSP